MTDAQHAAFYAFLFGVDAVLMFVASINGRGWWAVFFGLTAAFCAVATFAFTVELKGDQRPTATTNLNEKV